MRTGVSIFFSLFSFSLSLSRSRIRLSSSHLISLPDIFCPSLFLSLSFFPSISPSPLSLAVCSLGFGNDYLPKSQPFFMACFLSDVVSSSTALFACGTESLLFITAVTRPDFMTALFAQSHSKRMMEPYGNNFSSWEWKKIHHVKANVHIWFLLC